ncbi:Epsin-3, clathrin recruitment and traffic between the Golgi and endosome [Coemansia sp. RSA 552]|nr:Epsin-3, clathrin recruitment and traffic between the Golgi and endosome [Coemansia sp. RSA 552]
MDLNKLTDISVWDVRNVYNKVKNVVMNYSEMEVKVNEATGPEPWGASRSLMRELADATYNPKDFDDIMPMIYMRINDTDPAAWRQVYKALQLVEFLLKNGSERAVEDVRSHLTLIKMLKSFHHIDHNGKDQGVNVRLRSKEIVELVNDTERLRAERKTAKENRNKYQGYSGGASMEGFGSDSMGNSSGFGGASSGRRFGGLGSADYANDYYQSDPSTPSSNSAPISKKTTRQITPPAAPADDDDWGDFQGTGGLPAMAQAPMAPSTKPAGSSSAGIDLLGGGDIATPVLPTSPVAPAAASSSSPKPAAAEKKKEAFSDIWDVNSDLFSLDSLSLSKGKKPSDKKDQTMSMNQLASQKSSGYPA